ncbi:MAG: energy transducer TonB [Chthoniobacterales bacterium]
MPRIPLLIVALVLLAADTAGAASSIWQSAKPPKFPETALKRGSEGYVMIRVNVSPDGSVIRATVTKPSGDATLDEVGRAAVLKWKMKPEAIKREYATTGYSLRIEFHQAAPAIARYRDRTAYFESYKSTEIWMSTPAPEYPYEARRGRIEGTAYLKVLIGLDGRPAKLDLVKSSGNVHLDNAALAAVRLWRAHKQYAGTTRLVPVRFTLYGLR